jgi:hypothetical protein
MIVGCLGSTPRLLSLCTVNAAFTPIPTGGAVTGVACDGADCCEVGASCVSVGCVIVGTDTTGTVAGTFGVAMTDVGLTGLTGLTFTTGAGGVTTGGGSTTGGTMTSLIQLLEIVCHPLDDAVVSDVLVQPLVSC